jgi:hypothetical protein
LAAEREEFLERHRISTKFDSSRPLKQLWRNLKDDGIGRQSCGQTAMFSPEFNLHFTSAAAGSGSDEVFDRDEVFDGFAFNRVEEAAVFNAIMGIKSGAVGTDGFSIKFIRIVVPHILSVSVLTHLFNFVIAPSSFPTAWRTVIVLPLPKSKAPTGLADFRSISILPSVLSKGIERILCDQVVEYIEFCGFLSRFQSGFRRFHSTANYYNTVLMSIMDDIYLSVERSGFSVAFLLDFSKAFDFMVHGLLLWKLRVKFGLSSTAWRLFGSFLGQRAQKVMVDGEFSDVASVEMGSLQVCFFAYCLLFECKFHLYADDFQLYTVDLGEDVDTLVRLVNENLERIPRWSVDNSLVLNVSKTQVMLICRRNRGVVVEHTLTVAGDVVVFSDSVKNLGLYIDNRLSWREQVSRGILLVICCFDHISEFSRGILGYLFIRMIVL